MFQVLSRVIADAATWTSNLVFDAIVFVIAFVTVLLLGKFLLVPLTRRALDTRGFGGTVRSLGESLAGTLVWFLAIAVAFTVAGFGAFLAAFATIGGALALAVGFAARDLLSNFVAGIFILKDKPFDTGDWIEWKDKAGRVEDIDLRVSRVRTFDNEQITVPNSELANNAVTNPVAYDKLREKFVFGIGYDDDIDRARELIIEEISRVEDVLDDPAPDTRVHELGDSAVGIQARFWIGDPDRSDFVRVRSQVVQNVKERFDDEGIEMPYVYRQLTGEVEIEGLDGEVPDDAESNSEGTAGA